MGGLIGLGAEELRWPRPVHPGDVLRVESEVLGLRASQSHAGRGLVWVRNTTLNQDSDIPFPSSNACVPCRIDSIASIRPASSRSRC